MSGDGESFSHVSLHVSADWWVICHRYTDQTPILNVDAGPATVSLSIRGRNADEAAVKFARALVREAQAFAAEVERLHAERTTASTAEADESTDRAA
jgi:hypothetical protein